MQAVCLSRVPLRSSAIPLLRSLSSRLHTLQASPLDSLGASSSPLPHERLPETPPIVKPEPSRRSGAQIDPLPFSAKGKEPTTEKEPTQAAAAPSRRTRIRTPSKAAITLTPTAVDRLRALLESPTPTHLRIGVRQKGCAGMSYHLEYVTEPGSFDEVVDQDGVRVLIDSHALFSIIGSEMDWKDDLLSSKFVFKNPNIKDACGCGESFNVGQSVSI